MKIFDASLVRIFVKVLVANSGFVASHVTRDVCDGGWSSEIVL